MKMEKILVLVLAVLSVVIAGCTGATGPAGAAVTGDTVVAFQEGVYPSASYTGCDDNIILSSSPAANYGTIGSASTGITGGSVYRTIARFDCTYIIPANVTVTRAFLTLQAIIGEGSNTFNVYALTRGFGELTSNWNTYNGSNTWTTAGGDYGPALGQAQQADSVAKTVTIELDKTVVQGWISSPSTNYGYILKAENEITGNNQTQFGHSDNITASLRPRLTVYYRLP